MKSNATLPVEKRYSDGSFASHVYPGTKARRNHTDGIAVRVIEYTLDVVGEDRAVSSGRADDVPAADHDHRPRGRPRRRVGRAVFAAVGDRDRVRRTQDQPARAGGGTAVENPRRGDPGGLRPPLRALRHPLLMHSAATDSGHDPDRLVFTRTLRAARRTTASHPGLSPPTQHDAHRGVTTEILHERLPPDVPAPTPAWSNAKCPSSTSSTRITGTRPV